MVPEKLREGLGEISGRHGGRLVPGYPLRRHSSIGTGGPAGIWYTPASAEEIAEAAAFMNSNGAVPLIIGRASNILIPDCGLDRVVIRLETGVFGEMSVEGEKVTCGAGVPLAGFISLCCREGLAGPEDLVGIPATVGGAIASNASYRTAISDMLESVMVVMPDGSVERRDRKELTFGYRSSPFTSGEIILGAVFALRRAPAGELREKLRENFARKSEKQPLGEKSLGCIFRNPGGGVRPAGELIEKAGMKGARCGGAVVSGKHANFIVNDGSATSSDVIELMEEIKGRVREKFGVALVEEIKVLEPA